MKKEFIMLGLIFVLFSGLVIAESNENVGEGLAEGAGELKENLGDLSSGVGKGDEILAKEIEIPENLQFIVRIVFGLENEVSLSTIVTLLAVLTIFLLLIVDVLKWFRFQGIVLWGISISITFLLSIIGIVRFFADFFFGLGKFITFLEKWEIVKVILFFIIIFSVYIILAKILKFIGEKTKVSEAQEIGQDIGFAATIGRTLRNIFSRR